MHLWGDNWEGWPDLNKAEKVLYFWGNRLGRIGGQMKEKFGELRWYASFGKPSQLHDIVKHGHVAFRWGPEEHFFMCWLNNVSKAYIVIVAPLIFKYQKFMYGFAYHMACKRFPNIKAEVLGCVDHEELLFKTERKFLEDQRKQHEGEEI
jgi:hypothetical protein